MLEKRNIERKVMHRTGYLVNWNYKEKQHLKKIKNVFHIPTVETGLKTSDRTHNDD